MEAALLGYDVANTNGALVIDNYKIFQYEDLDMEISKKHIVHDPVWKALDKSTNFKVTITSNELLHDDILEILTTLKHDDKKKEEILNHLTKNTKTHGKEYNSHIMVELLRLGGELHEPLALLRLGDIYQEGKVVQQNYTKAYEYYADLIRSQYQPGNNLLSQAYHHLAYMNHKGLGRPKDLTRAIQFYNKSLELDKSTYYLNYLNKKLAEWEKMYFEKSEEEDHNGRDLAVTDIVKLNVEHFEKYYSKALFLGFMLVAIVVLYLVKLRLQNYTEIYLKDHHHSQ